MPNLIDVQELAKGAADRRIIDVRWYLKASPNGLSGQEEYLQGHLPGAQFVDLERDITGNAGPGRHPLPTREQMNACVQRLGILPTTHVVAYDDAGGSIAARFWFLLRLFGHEYVQVLDGGIQAWTAAGLPLTMDLGSTRVSTYELKEPNLNRVVNKDDVARAAASGALILDARAGERYRGEVEPIDARPGHVPSAKNAPWSQNLASGTFRSPSELNAYYTQMGVATDRELIVYCGSGVTACHDLLALEDAGFTHAKLYEGSWGDWAKDATLKASLGSE